ILSCSSRGSFFLGEEGCAITANTESKGGVIIGLFPAAEKTCPPQKPRYLHSMPDSEHDHCTVKPNR
ncbi:MAG: hypothetical protein QMB70_11020, partial [Aeromonadaceae bacterium]